ncbi:MAG: four helix bundle protein [Candidatus Omnitrophica bacterium]|nr:four helix bundle protein [Candidatus Omnitrophota bacterium]
MDEKIRDFSDLNVWKKGMEIVEEIYKTTQKFPPYELYGLTTQMRRAAVSIPSNIAEGFARKHNKEYKQFLYVVLGSSAELETQIEISLRLGFIVEEKRNVLLEKIDHANRMTMNLIKCL